MWIYCNVLHFGEIKESCSTRAITFLNAHLKLTFFGKENVHLITNVYFALSAYF